MATIILSNEVLANLAQSAVEAVEVQVLAHQASEYGEEVRRRLLEEAEDLQEEDQLSTLLDSIASMTHEELVKHGPSGLKAWKATYRKGEGSNWLLSVDIGDEWGDGHGSRDISRWLSDANIPHTLA